jgi:eukaryotic translation initiation factor 2C
VITIYEAQIIDKSLQFIEDLKEMAKERLRTYFIISKGTTLPDHILFYSDGVGESRYGMVYTEEIPQIGVAVSEIKVFPKNEKFENWNASITLLIVGKRHHARFYKRPTLKLNIDAGMVVDHTVVALTPLNFYLQSHDSSMGIARNGYYVVIVNETNYSPT